MVAQRCGISLRVFNLISQELDIELNTRREIPYLHLQAAMYYFAYYINILMTTFLTIFRRFPITFLRFPKSLKISE